ncbi:hypothetical protein CVS40_5411 [Lucilia cuprina]|nr:hypothetical protein CVS40_5411 [Lucilia cuprina]
MLQQTYPKTLNAPHYQTNTLVGSKDDPFAVSRKQIMFHKVRSSLVGNISKNTLKKVPTVIKLVNGKLKATSTSRLWNN